jgi:hypothetical protein
LLARLLWATTPDTAIRQTYSEELLLGLFVDAGSDFSGRAFLNHDCTGHHRSSTARAGPVPKATRFAEQACIDLDCGARYWGNPNYRGAPPSVPPANASVAAADSAAL